MKRRRSNRRKLDRRFSPAPRRTFEGQEARIVNALPDGKPVPGSGNGRRPSQKSDATGDIWRGEGKTVERARVESKSFSVKRADLHKIAAEAAATRQRPIYVFGWPGRTAPEDWAAFQLPVAEAMMRTVSALLSGDVEQAMEYAELVKP